MTIKESLRRQHAGLQIVSGASLVIFASLRIHTYALAQEITNLADQKLIFDSRSVS